MEKGPGILVAVDFEEPSEYGVEQACMIARLFDAPITLLCVMEQVGLFSRLFSSEENLNRYMDRVRQRFDEVENFHVILLPALMLKYHLLLKKAKFTKKYFILPVNLIL
ncbi:MAG: universal stress protein [Bacteroidales bacterium]|nr:universal stress protein [Bacteroidales bacterium]